jgi:hypothetical protein
MTDPTLDSRNCGCKYCSKTKSQVEVNQVQGLRGLQRPPEHHLRGTLPTPGEILTHARRRVIREKMKEEKSKPAKRADQPLTALPERLRDLNSGRTFRPFELVWVALQEPISVTEDRSIMIDFWPATISSYTTKNEPTPHKPGDTNYDIISRCIFTIRLLGVNHQVSVPEDRLLPQLGYVPSQGLLNAVKDCEPSRPLNPEFTEYMHFNPLPEFDSALQIPPGSYTSQDALPAFCLALHIVACLTPVWCATHSYSSEDKKAQVDDLFQGLWWGSERIWLDDVVRLRPSRDELDPENTLGFLPPSSPDAATRALLLRLTYIVVDREDPTGMSICVGGDLYELARKETQPQSPKQQSVQQPIFGPPTGLLGPTSTQFGPPVASSSGSGVSATIGPSVAESAISMPPPPPGFVFRKLLRQGSEMVVDVGAIAGRYYPKIIQADTLDRVVRTLNQETGVRAGETVHGTVDGYARERIRQARRGQEAFEAASDELTQLLALSGLFLGEGNAMQPEQWAKGRMQTIKGAELNGKKVLFEQWTKPVGGSSDVEMVDA